MPKTEYESTATCTLVPVGPLLAAQPVPLFSDGSATLMCGGDGDSLIGVDVYDLGFAHLAVVNVELECALVDAGRQYLHGAPKGGVVDARFLALLIVDDVVHVGILLNRVRICIL